MTPILFYDLPFGITTIDVQCFRQNFAGSHLIIEGDSAAFVDVGTSFSASLLLEGLAIKRIPRENVEYVIVTHIHLDHAGGAGELMSHLPNAKFVVHPRGARHMIDPQKLINAAIDVYGVDRVKEDYGNIIPIPKERVIEAEDGLSVDMNGRTFLFLDTPGHAKHHVCVFDERSQGIFTGDAFGLSYRELDTDRGAFILPTTSPAHFAPEAMRQSVKKIMSYRPQNIFFTHFSHVTNVPHLVDDFLRRLDQFLELGQQLKNHGKERHALFVQGMGDFLLSELKQHGSTLSEKEALEVLAVDLELSTQGIEIWLDQH
ncbi:MAG: MBL fold metallo-hydrolase [SAR324 cluster bacterium]|nr:MBL fold metallo-hydrolase [SAR324 cluster bacterium]